MMSRGDLEHAVRLWDKARRTPALKGSPAHCHDLVDNTLDRLLRHLYPSKGAQNS